MCAATTPVAHRAPRCSASVIISLDVGVAPCCSRAHRPAEQRRHTSGPRCPRGCWTANHGPGWDRPLAPPLVIPAPLTCRWFLYSVLLLQDMHAASKQSHSRPHGVFFRVFVSSIYCPTEKRTRRKRRGGEREKKEEEERKEKNSREDDMWWRGPQLLELIAPIQVEQKPVACDGAGGRRGQGHDVCRGGRVVRAHSSILALPRAAAPSLYQRRRRCCLRRWWCLQLETPGVAG